MGKSVKSARGDLVNFDLLKIKQQMATAPKTQTVKAREDFIDQKFKRRIKKLTRQLPATPAEPLPTPDPDFAEDETEVESE